MNFENGSKQCLKCGNAVNPGESYCQRCGMPVSNPETVSVTPTISAETLKKYYIGNNYEKMKNNGYSFCTFLFGPLYLMYRKQYLFGILWSLSYFLMSLLLLVTPLAIFIPLLSAIIIGAFFKHFYQKKVEKQVRQIMESNPNASQEELQLLCMKKGGTSIGGMILGSIGSGILISLIMVIVTPFIMQMVRSENTDIELGEGVTLSFENCSHR